MSIGALDPLEGAVLILPGAGLAALGTLLTPSRYRKLLGWSFVLIAAGVGAMMVLTVLGGTGGNSGRSMWWALTVLPYPAGWIMGIAGSVLRLVEIKRARPSAGKSAGTTR